MRETTRRFLCWASLALVLLAMGAGDGWADPVYQLGVSRDQAIDKARVQAFANIKPQISTVNIPAVDPEFEAHREALRQGNTQAGRHLMTLFGDGGYSIRDLKTGERWYYNRRGQLQQVELADTAEGFPSRAATYDIRDGRLSRVVSNVSTEESYIFSPQGELLYHWVGQQCFRLDGQSCGLRQRVVGH